TQSSAGSSVSGLLQCAKRSCRRQHPIEDEGAHRPSRTNSQRRRMSEFRIAAAGPGDIPTVLAMIRGLAEFERLSHLCVATEEDLFRALFSERPTAEVILAWEGAEAAGFALFFHNFSTFLGRPGLYLEDLFVRPHFRGRGYGRALLVYLASLALARGR